MSAPSPGHAWQRLVDEKARELHEQIAAAYLWVKEQGGGDEDLFKNITGQQYEWLRNLYEHELPLARLLDEADLTLELDGPAIRMSHPRISVVTRTFSRVQDRVLSVARTISGFPESAGKRRFRLPHDMELGFISVARGSGLRFGFTIPDPPTAQESLLGSNDPTYQAVTKAVFAIRDLSISMADVQDTEDESEVAEHARETLDDPRLRDAALVAVKDLTPARQAGIDTVKVAGRGVERHEIKPLTIATRRALSHLVSSPVRSREGMTFKGVVREIDLDSRRFDLRGINEGQLNDLRCVYGKEAIEDDAKNWLGHRLVVEGRIERDHNGKPRLLQIRKLEDVDASGLRQSIFEFSGESEG